MGISIRLEEEKDFSEVNFLTREAFWNVHCQGCDEHYLAHLLRKSPIFIKELDFVAEIDGKIVGNILYSKGIVKDGDREFEAITFGPVSVLPAFQKQGIGKALVEHSLAAAKSLGYKLVIIYGNPQYYRRFGFESAEKFGIQTREGENFDAFMALNLSENDLKDVKGRFFEFEGIDLKKGFEEFESAFPYKQKLKLPTQWH